MFVVICNCQELEEKLEYWMEKYDKDTEEKQAELNSLKTSRTNNLLLLSDLTKQVRITLNHPPDKADVFWYGFLMGTKKMPMHYGFL